MSVLLQDLKYGLRIYKKSPAFTVIAIISLALATGASISVFGAVSAVLLKKLPYPQPEKIVIPWRIAPPGIGYVEFPWARPQCLFFQDEAKSFESLGAFKTDSFSLTGRGEPIKLDGARASVGFFPSLGVRTILGRIFVKEEDQPGHEHVVVLGYQLWQDQFSGDSNILGQAIELNGYVYTVVGVMSPDFDFPRAEGMPPIFSFPRMTQLWVPLALHPGPPTVQGEDSDLALVGRLRPGIGTREAQTEMDLLTKRLEAMYPWGKGWFKSQVVTLDRQVTGDTRQPLLSILGGVGVVLLVACANVAGLLLTRSLARRREFAVRVALGSGRSRLVRQLLTESAILALGGGAIGIMLSAAGVYFVRAFGPSNVPRLRETGFDFGVAVFALVSIFVTTILFGLAPALRARKIGPLEFVKDGERSVGTSSGLQFRKMLLVCEIALAFVLLIASGLLVRTFLHLLRVNPGFNPDRVLTFEITLPALEYSDEAKVVDFYQKALQRLRSVPGVDMAGIVETLPMGGATSSTAFRIPGRPKDPKLKLYANYTITSPGYFATVGTPILRGRDFFESDTAGSMPVVIINATMANKFWADSDPLGKQLGTPTIKESTTIIGVVPDTKHVSLGEEPAPEMYVPFTQKVHPSMLTMDVVLHTKGDAISITESAKNAMHSVAPDVPLARLTTLKDIVDDSISAKRFSVVLLSAFASMALLLASIGMYGMISYLVAQRTREIGVRMALGAQPRDVFLMIIGESARLTGLGITLGLIGAFAVTRLMRGFLYGVQPVDLFTFVTVAVLSIAVAFVAGFVPTRRATRIDPMVALRYE